MTKHLETYDALKQINTLLKININESLLLIVICIFLFIFYFLLIQLLSLFIENDNIYLLRWNISGNQMFFMNFFAISPMVVFYYLNNHYNMFFWKKYGFSLNEKYISSSEKKHYSKLIHYPYNTYSSSCQTLAGSYFIIKSFYVINFKTTFLLGVYTTALGLFSYLWWSSNKLIFRKYDHVFMELHCLSLGISFISLALLYNQYNLETTLTLCQILYFIIRIKNITRAKIGLSILFVQIASIVLIISNMNIGYIMLYYLGLISITLGIIFKTFDKHYNFKYGTAIFHLCAALTFVLCFEWSQTVINSHKQHSLYHHNNL